MRGAGWCFLEGDFYPPKKPQKEERRGNTTYCAHFKAEKMRKQLDKCLVFGDTSAFSVITMVTTTNLLVSSHLTWQCQSPYYCTSNEKISTPLYSNPFRPSFQYSMGKKTLEKDLWNGFTIKAFKCVCVLKIGLSKKSFSGLALCHIIAFKALKKAVRTAAAGWKFLDVIQEGEEKWKVDGYKGIF